VQQLLPNNQDVQQSLEFRYTLHRIHLHHLLGQVIAADPQHKFQQSVTTFGSKVIPLFWKSPTNLKLPGRS
jgi:hypothetical protein